MAAAAGAAPAQVEPGPGACPPPRLEPQSLAPGLWWLPAAGGDADAHNRGQVSNLLIALDGPRLWLIGSGPSPAFGLSLACQLRERFGQGVTDVVSPWPRPEAVLGVAGLGPVRHWAHADVAAAMGRRCAGCVERLRQQLDRAADDLGAGDPVRGPTELFSGADGRLGPWRWWRLDRGDSQPVTVWAWAGDASAAGTLHFAPGLLWGDGAPDARDADVQRLADATRALARLPGAEAAGLRWLGEQGPPSTGLLARHLRYWDELFTRVHAAQARGDDEAAAAPGLPGTPASDPRHALNWQRAWRQLEDGVFQRSLR